VYEDFDDESQTYILVPLILKDTEIGIDEPKSMEGLSLIEESMFSY